MHEWRRKKAGNGTWPAHFLEQEQEQNMNEGTSTNEICVMVMIRVYETCL